MAPLPAQAADPVYVPKELEPWKKWVLEGKPNMRCPFIGNSPQAQRICAWSSPLVLSADSSGAKFSVDWTLYDSAKIPLPGNSRYWPEGVEVNGKPVPVINPSHHPSIRLKEGSYKVTGFFHWEKLPKWFPLPAATALVNLKVHGRPVPFPLYNGNSIGLGKTQMDGQQSAPKSLAIKVFRKLHDDIPFRVTTRIILDVSGPGREELLGHALLPGTIPMAIKSPLPARLEPNRRLRLQVKPGHWEIDLISRYHGPVSEIRLEDPGEPWASEEVWSYQANTALHLTEVSNLMSIDPTRTGVPKEWINLPAYRAPVGGTFVITEKRRGSADPNADSLAIVRKIWLDFDGGGFTFQDELTGVMTEGWRLNVDPESQLGRASVAGRDQLITFSEDGTGAGVEIRQGGLQMTAVSRMKTGKYEFNAAGWQHDLNSLQATLFLPPGYRVFTASGVDRAYQTWVSQWTLLDLFLMLIIAALVTTVAGRKWGVLALVTLAITYHQHGAPVYAWLSILASVALLGKLPPGKFKTVVTWYRNLSYVSLVIIALPFMIDQVRQSLYPQLERFGSWAPGAQSQIAQSPQFENKRQNIPGKARKKKAAPEVAEESLMEDPGSSGLYSRSDKFGLYGSSSRGFKRFDPNANIQTGPGLPAWQGNRVSLSWNGPVQKEDRVRLVLLSPGANRLLGFLRVILIAFLAYILLTVSSSRDGGFRLPRFRSSGVVAGVLLLFGLLISPAQVSADIPSQEILQQLENRLLAPPKCVNHCFDIQRALVTVRDGRLQLRLEAHALEHVALPLPGHRERWLPESILVNGKPAKKILRRGAEEGVWVRLPQGIHQIMLSGKLPSTDRVDLRFPHKPHKIKISSQGWEVAGVNEGRMLNDTLEITRIQKKSSSEVLRSEAPPAFVIIERLLRIGLDWQVETRVRSGISGLGSINLKVPLLAGESILSEHVKLKDGMVIVSLGGARREVSWVSTLDKMESVVLKASGKAIGWSIGLWMPVRFIISKLWDCRPSSSRPKDSGDPSSGPGLGNP